MFERLALTAGGSLVFKSTYRSSVAALSLSSLTRRHFVVDVALGA